MRLQDREGTSRLAVSLLSHALERGGFVQGRTLKRIRLYYKGELATIIMGTRHGVTVLAFDLAEEEAR
jgi:hypothetical protein